MKPSTRGGRNVEVKCRLTERERAIHVCQSLGAVFTNRLVQIDTYFATTSGRLKLREEAGSAPVLIAYDRPNAETSTGSSYTLHALDALPADLRAA